MRNRTWFFTLYLVVSLASCNFPTTRGTSTPVATPIPSGTRSVPPSPTLTFTATAFLSVALPKSATVNCRSGPAVTYTVVGELRPGRQAEVIGKSADLAWWYVKNPSDPSTSCWLFAEVVSIEGNVETLPVVNPPGVTVTAVTVSVEPPVMNVACNAFPQLVTINIQISASGPSTVFWRWEEVSTGDLSEEQSLLFEEGGTKTVQDLYQVRSARDYTMVVRTLQPNEATGRATFKAVCTP
jgi:hypothetical protein